MTIEELRIPIGKNHYLRVDESGFSLWDRKTGTWILDASTFSKEQEIHISIKKTKQWVNKHTRVRRIEWK